MANIAISGAQGTGKSTLLDALSKLPELKNYEFIKENMRDLVDEGYSINEDSGDRLAFKVAQENLKLSEMKNVVTDRYFLDGYVYATYFWKQGSVSDDVMQYYDELLYKLNTSADVIFYIRPEFDIEDDGFRSTCTEFRDGIVEIFEEYIRAYNIPVVVLTGSVEDRVQQVYDTITKYDYTIEQKQADISEETIEKYLNKISI